MLRLALILVVSMLPACAAPVPPETVDDEAGIAESEPGVEPPEPAQIEESTVKKQFSRRLSPQARRAALLGGEGEIVRALVQVAASADFEELKERLAQEGAEVGAWMEETRLLTVTIESARLEALAQLPGVIYVEVATTYRD